MSGCDDNRLLLGSYALGGLEADEAAAVERHLETCPQCRQVHEQLAPLPGLLDLVEPGRETSDVPSAPLERAVLASYRVEPKPSRGRARWRPRLLVALPSALAGAALAIAVLAITTDPADPGPSTNRVELEPSTGEGGRAIAELVPTSTGTRVELDARLPSLRGGEVYELWFVRPHGRTSAGTFTVDRDGRAELELTTAAGGGRYRSLGITREPDALDPARNGPSVAAGLLEG